MDISAEFVADLGEKILVACVVFVLATIVVNIVRYALYHIFNMGLLRTQIVETVGRFATIAGCVYIVLGGAVARALLGGFSIGLGYALQPLWLGALNVLWIKSERRHILAPNKKIRFADKEYTVAEVGLFHVTVTRDNETMFISNSKLSENITILGPPDASPPSISSKQPQFKFT